jgi:hypothetical protein
MIDNSIVNRVAIVENKKHQSYEQERRLTANGRNFPAPSCAFGTRLGEIARSATSGLDAMVEGVDVAAELHDGLEYSQDRRQLGGPRLC